MTNTTTHPQPNKNGFWHTDNTMTSVRPGLLVEVGFYGQGVETYAKLTPAEARQVAANLTAAANKATPKEHH